MISFRYSVPDSGAPSGRVKCKMRKTKSAVTNGETREEGVSGIMMIMVAEVVLEKAGMYL